MLFLCKISWNYDSDILWVWSGHSTVEWYGEIINHKEDVNFSVSNFDKMFGIQDDKFLTFLFLIIKYYIFVSKFQNKKPNFANLLNFIKNIRETECNIANKSNKLPIYFKICRFDLLTFFFLILLYTHRYILHEFFLDGTWLVHACDFMINFHFVASAIVCVCVGGGYVGMCGGVVGCMSL